jgi:hypothetical protein
MTQQVRQNMPPPTTEVAKDQATDVGRTTADAGRHVADTATEQAGQVAQEAKRQARDLLGEARSQAREQAQTGQQKAADSIRGLAVELREMAEGGDRHGTASELASQASDRLGGVADWIGAREPGELVEEVRRFARRRPGAFLLGAAVAGVVAGRLTRGAVDAQRDTDSDVYPTDHPASSTIPLPPVTPAVPLTGPPPTYQRRPAGGPPAGSPVGAPPPPPYPPGDGPLPAGSVAPAPAARPPASPPPVASPAPGPQHSPHPGPPADEYAVEYADEMQRGTGPQSGGAR